MERPISIVGTKVVQMAVDPDVSIADLAKLAATDPAFAARILHLVNSAGYGARSKVSEIKQACGLLGARALRNVALSLIVSDMVPLGANAQVLLEVALRRAVSAKLVARLLGVQPLDEAFTVGLFMDVGLLIEARADLAIAIQIARMPAAERPLVERAFGRNAHVVTSTKLAQEMGLPLAVTKAIAQHHDAEPEPLPLSRVAWLAERVAGAWEASDAARGHAAALAAFAKVGIPTEAAETLLAELPGELAAAAASFDRTIAEQPDLTKLTADAQLRLVELNHGYEQLVRRLEAILREKDAIARELEDANASLSKMAALDALTQISNRRSFEDSLRRDLARSARTREPLSLLILDVDHFKRVNDLYGHPTGDRVLVEVAKTLCASVRACDFPARYGGEEFVAILPNATVDNARIVAERVRQALEKCEIVTDKGVLRVTASFGVAGLRAAETAEALIERADTALYQAKHAGRNLVTLAA